MKIINLENIGPNACIVKQGEIAICEHRNKVGGLGNLHTHSCYELEVLIAGQSTVTLNSSSYPVDAGCFWLSVPNGLHLLPVPEITHLISIKFSEELLSRELFLLLRLISGDLIGRMSSTELTQWYQEFAGTVEACNQMRSDDIRTLYLKNKLEGWLLRMIDLGCDLQTSGASSILADERLYQVVSYIKNHFRENISVQDISRMFGYTPNYFSSKFKTLFGRSFTQFVNDERLRLSYHLLESSEMTVHEVAEYVGYDSDSYFHKIFKARFSRTPREIRTHGTKT